MIRDLIACFGLVDAGSSGLKGADAARLLICFLPSPSYFEHCPMLNPPTIAPPHSKARALIEDGAQTGTRSTCEAHHSIPRDMLEGLHPSAVFHGLNAWAVPGDSAT